MFPDGLANSSGQVGRNYMRHMTGSVYATFEKNRCICYRGTTMAGIIRDEAKNDPKARLRRRLYEMETLSLGFALHGRVPQSGRVGTAVHERK